MGGKVKLNSRVTKVNHDNFYVRSIEYIDEKGNVQVEEGTDFISSMPITELLKALNPKPPEDVMRAAENLGYRSIITVDIIIDKKDVFPDNWIYIHSPEVKLGRIQNFKNWSSSMVPDQSKTSLGLEYFCTEGDELWNMPDEELFKLASSEIEKIKICKSSDIIDYVIIKVPKAYPVYMTGYRKYMDIIEEYAKKFSNLQFVGRYGMFKYNNMDHSIMTGIYAAKNIIQNNYSFDTWSINTEPEYHEEKQERRVEKLKPVRQH